MIMGKDYQSAKKMLSNLKSKSSLYSKTNFQVWKMSCLIVILKDIAQDKSKLLQVIQRTENVFLKGTM